LKLETIKSTFFMLKIKHEKTFQ